MSRSKRTAALALLLGSCAMLSASSGRAQAPTTPSPQEVAVVAVMTNPETGSPVVVLQGKRDGRTFAMAIGPAEAVGIALPLAHRTAPRPLTHDLVTTMLGRLGASVSRAVITDFRDDIFYATLYLRAGDAEQVLDARPSDAIALALRAQAPVLVEERVLDRAEIFPPAPSSPGGPRI
jgi:uncharacterized protein